jgi:hypothetical protein
MSTYALANYMPFCVVRGEVDGVIRSRCSVRSDQAGWDDEADAAATANTRTFPGEHVASVS